MMSDKITVYYDLNTDYDEEYVGRFNNGDDWDECHLDECENCNSCHNYETCEICQTCTNHEDYEDWKNCEICKKNCVKCNELCEEYVSPKCIGLSYIDCVNCGDRTCYGFYDVDCSFISYECKNCHLFFMICNKCYVYGKDTKSMTFLKARCFNKDGIITNLKRKDVLFRDDTKSYEAFPKKRTIKAIKHVEYFDENVLGLLTGPDGGCKSKWHCSICNKNYVFSDK